MAKTTKTSLSSLLPAVSTHETVYALLQLPEETEETLAEAIQLQAETLSPFDEGDYTTAWEILGKRDGMLFVWIALASNDALTTAWHDTLSARNQIAKVRMDATALCWLEALPKRYPTLSQGQRLLILRTAREHLICLFDEGLPVTFRGLPPTATDADLQREATWVLTQASLSGALNQAHLQLVCCAPSMETMPRVDGLTETSPLSEILSNEEADALLQQTLQARNQAGKSFDLTPQIWRDEARAKRNKSLLTVVACLFGLAWAAGALTLFLLPKMYAQRAKEAALRIQAHRTVYNEVVGLQERIDLIMRYQDRRFSALEMLRLVCAAKAEDMTFLSVNYRQKQSLRITGNCATTASVYDFKEAVQKDARIQEVRINRLAQDAKTRQQRFDIDILFVTASEDNE